MVNVTAEAKECNAPNDLRTAHCLDYSVLRRLTSSSRCRIDPGTACKAQSPFVFSGLATVGMHCMSPADLPVVDPSSLLIPATESVKLPQTRLCTSWPFATFVFSLPLLPLPTFSHACELLQPLSLALFWLLARFCSARPFVHHARQTLARYRKLPKESN